MKPGPPGPPRKPPPRPADAGAAVVDAPAGLVADGVDVVDVVAAEGARAGGLDAFDAGEAGDASTARERARLTWRDVATGPAEAAAVLARLPVGRAGPGGGERAGTEGGHGAARSARAVVERAARDDALLRALFDLSKRRGVTFGVWGGSARDLLLGEARGAGSDIDFLYDSSEPGYPAFRDEALALCKEIAPEVKVDFAADLKKPAPWGTRRGATIDKLGVLADGTLFDFSGRGLADLEAGHVHVFFGDGEPYGRLSHAVRALKLLARYPQLSFDEDGEAELRRAVARHRREGNLAASAAWWREQTGGTRPDDDALGSIRHAYKKAGRAPPQGDVVDIAYTLRTIVKRKLGATARSGAPLIGFLQRTGLASALADMGLDAELAPLRAVADDDERALRRTLDRAALRDTARLVLDAVAAEATEAADPALAALVDRARARLAALGDEARAEPPAPRAHGLSRGDADAVAAAALVAAGASVERAGALVAAAAEALTHTRGELTFRDRFALLPAQPLPQVDGAPVPLELVRAGYFPEVDAVDPSAPHSMHDVDGYVRARLWPAVIDDVVAHGRIVEIHEGSREATFASLAARGFGEVARVEVPKGERFNQLWLAKNAESGELRWVMTELWGFERVFHQQLLWRMAGVSGKNIELRREPMRADVEAVRSYTRAVLATGQAPDLVVVGFVNTFKRDLARRAAAAAAVDVLAAVPADARPPAVAEALALVERGRGAQSAAHFVFRRKRAVESVERAVASLQERAARASARTTPNQAALVDAARALADGSAAYVADVGGDMLDQAALVVRTSDGRPKALRIVRMPYGELARHLGTALLEQGVQKVVVAGTAGGLGVDSALGDLVLPSRIEAHDGRALRVDNLLKPYIDDAGLAATLEAKTALVRSPLEETAELIADMRIAGFDAVEMESGFFAQAFEDSYIDFGALHIVSDLPGTEQTLEAHLADGAVKHAFDEAGDALLASMDIVSVEPLTTPEHLSPAPPTAFARAAGLAERILGDRFAGPEYTLMRTNAARYLLNGLPWRIFESADLAFLAERPERLRMSSRWAEKLERDLAAPYTDAEALAALKKKEGDLLHAARVLLRDPRAKDASLHLMGGITKARFGGGSDLDLLVDSPDKSFVDWALHSEVGVLNEGAKEIRLGELAFARARAERYAGFVELGKVGDVAAKAAPLVDVLKASFANIGMRFDEATGHVEVLGDVTALDVAPEVPESDEHVLEHEKRYAPLFDTRALLRYLDAGIDPRELRAFSRDALVEIGVTLLDRFFVAGLDLDRLSDFVVGDAAAAFFDGPRGRAVLEAHGVNDAHGLVKKGPAALGDALRALGPEEVFDLAGVSDPLERLAMLLAGFEAAKRDAESASVSRAVAAAAAASGKAPAKKKPKERVDPAPAMFASMKERFLETVGAAARPAVTVRAG